MHDPREHPGEERRLGRERRLRLHHQQPHQIRAHQRVSHIKYALANGSVTSNTRSLMGSSALNTLILKGQSNTRMLMCGSGQIEADYWVGDIKCGPPLLQGPRHHPHARPAHLHHAHQGQQRVLPGPRVQAASARHRLHRVQVQAGARQPQVRRGESAAPAREYD